MADKIISTDSITLAFPAQQGSDRAFHFLRCERTLETTPRVGKFRKTPRSKTLVEREETTSETQARADRHVREALSDAISSLVEEYGQVMVVPEGEV